MSIAIQQKCIIVDVSVCECSLTKPTLICRYDLPEQCRLKMTENDIKTGKELLQEAFIMKNPEWMKELQIMVCIVLISKTT